MKVGDLVRWKTHCETPAIAIIVSAQQDDQAFQSFNLLFGSVPDRLQSISSNGIVRGFGPWELEMVVPAEF